MVNDSPFLLTVELRLTPAVLARTASVLSAKTKRTQKAAVVKVLVASDQRRPNEDSTI